MVDYFWRCGYQLYEGVLCFASGASTGGGAFYAGVGASGDGKDANDIRPGKDLVETEIVGSVCACPNLAVTNQSSPD